MLEMRVHNVSGGQTGHDCFLLCLQAVVDHGMLEQALQCPGQDVSEDLRKILANAMRASDITDFVHHAHELAKSIESDDDLVNSYDISPELVTCYRAETAEDAQRALADTFEKRGIDAWQLVVDVINVRLAPHDHHVLVATPATLEPVDVLDAVRATTGTVRELLVDDQDMRHKFHVLIKYQGHYQFVSMTSSEHQPAVEFLPEFINWMRKEATANIQVTVEGMADLQA